MAFLIPLPGESGLKLRDTLNPAGQDGSGSVRKLDSACSEPILRYVGEASRQVLRFVFVGGPEDVNHPCLEL